MLFLWSLIDIYEFCISPFVLDGTSPWYSELEKCVSVVFNVHLNMHILSVHNIQMCCALNVNFSLVYLELLGIYSFTRTEL